MLESIPPEWLASITSSSILAALGSIFFILYKAKIEKRVQFHFDERLEETRNIFRKEEEIFKDELRKKGEQIAVLRTGALTRLEKHHLAIDERKLRAIENIWTSVVRQSKLKTLSIMTGAMKMDSAIEAASKDDSNALKLQEFASTLWDGMKLDDSGEIESAYQERPFAPPLIWALYSAYIHIVSYAFLQLAAMRTGIGPKILADPEPLLKLVKSALPHQKSFIDEMGTGGLPHLIEELENTLVREIQKSLRNPDTDDEDLEKAAEIMKNAERVIQSMQKQSF